jgi:hypothetical protein
MGGATGWTFLTNHGHVLICLSVNPDLRLRDIADQVGITERAVHRVVSELAAEGYLEILKDGRRNRYVVHAEQPMRHPMESHLPVGALLDLMPGGEPTGA